jgi:hypothetical protein
MPRKNWRRHTTDPRNRTQHGGLTLQKYLVRTAAWLEFVTGVSLIMSPKLACDLLFAAQLDGAGVAIARYSGVVLLALATACLATPPKPHPRGAASGLLVYNIGVVVLFAWLGLATALHGLLLWPAVILHTVFAAALLAQLLAKRSSAT